MEKQHPFRTSCPKAGRLELRGQICRLLQWGELEYGTLQYENGLAYLGHYIAQDKWGQDLLQRTRLFWNWWKNQWALRDQAFILEHKEQLYRMSMDNRRRLYLHLHDAATLASEIYPGRLVFEESYNQMIADLIKTEVHV